MYKIPPNCAVILLQTYMREQPGANHGSSTVLCSSVIWGSCSEPPLSHAKGQFDE